LGKHTPVSLHVSCSEQVLGPEPQFLPGTGEYALPDFVGSHTRHGLSGASAPLATQLPATWQPAQLLTHPPVLVSQRALSPHWLAPGVQTWFASSQVDTPLHATPSSHDRGVPTQVPWEQASATVQKSPSSQVAPSLSDQLEALRVGSQI
jgi:hypothetical protein